jgi:aryl-alcohol dehydrogenase-like predicted oxidoreductase
MVWGYGKGGYSDADIRAGFDASLEAGINFVDTAEVYGFGRSERLLGSFLPTAAKPVLTFTKFLPIPWRLGKGAVVRALRGSLKRLNLPQVDLYQLHWASPVVPVETYVEGLAEAVQLGLTRAVGVSNYNVEQMYRAHAVLSKHGIPLASNQVPYSLLDRRVEFNGVLKACRDLGVTLIAYSPIAQGALTGKYTPANPMTGVRARQWPAALLERIQPLLKRMAEIGQAHGGKSPSQVALNWLIGMGTAPIPGAKNSRQAQENAGALGWDLSEAEMAELDELSRRVGARGA